MKRKAHAVAIGKRMPFGRNLQKGEHIMANRYTLTNEQRQQQVQDLTQQLEDGVKSVFESEKYAQYLKVMSHFTHYSRL